MKNLSRSEKFFVKEKCSEKNPQNPIILRYKICIGYYFAKTSQKVLESFKKCNRQLFITFNCVKNSSENSTEINHLE